jgi:nucleotide-binding universal stress UspA family protein
LPLRPNARITIVHVLETRADRATDSLVRAEAERQLDATKAKMADWLDVAGRSNFTIKLRLLRGTPVDELGELALATGPELIVLGRRGDRGFRDLLIGSTALRVAREARYPVLVVASPPRGSYRCLVTGFDYSPHALRAAKLGARLLPMEGRAVVVHASRDAENRDRLRPLALALRRAMPVRPGGGPWQVVVRAQDPRGLILDLARRRNADLIAVGSLGRTGVARLVMGSVAEAVLQHAPVDVLVAPRRVR